MLSGSKWGTLGAFDSDPLLGAVLLPPYGGGPHPSAQGGRASGPDASDLSRLHARAPPGHPAAEVGGQQACPGQSWGLSGHVRALCCYSLIRPYWGRNWPLTPTRQSASLRGQEARSWDFSAQNFVGLSEGQRARSPGLSQAFVTITSLMLLLLVGE